MIWVCREWVAILLPSRRITLPTKLLLVGQPLVALLLVGQLLA